MGSLIKKLTDIDAKCRMIEQEIKELQEYEMRMRLPVVRSLSLPRPE